MASVEQIQGAITLSQAYYIQLLDANTANREVGLPDKHVKTTTCLRRLMLAIGWDLAINVNDTITTALYDLLMKALANYNGSGLSYDPNVVIPGGPTINQTGITANYNEGIIEFNNVTTVEILNYATTLANIYGNNPGVQLMVAGFSEDEQTAPIYNYLTPTDPTTPLQSIVWTSYPQAVSGYIKIWGSVPASTSGSGGGGSSPIPPMVFTQANLLYDSVELQWYLPLTLPTTLRPLYVENNLVGTGPGTYDRSYTPPRLYGFAANTVTQSIKVFIGS